MAFNDLAEIHTPEFVRLFRPNFPVGWTDRLAVQDYLQHLPSQQFTVPIYVFIDRQGTIRAQHMGSEPFFKQELANSRALVESLLKAPAAGKKK